MAGSWAKFIYWLGNAFGSDWKAIPMLAKLPEVDWGRLVHAYGRASDVPGLIRALASRRAWWRSKARSQLYCNIWHQGTIYEATGYAVPFLIGLLEAEVVQEKHELLMLLSEIVRGNSYHDVHQHGFLKERAQTPEWQSAIQQELKWVRAAREAVIAGRPIYLKLLSHPEIKVRESAPYLLACLPGENAEVANALWHRLRDEPEAPVRVSLILAIGVLPANEISRQWLEQLLMDERDPAVRLAVAMSLARLLAGKLPEEATTILLEAISQPKRVADRYASSPWADAGNIEAQVSEYLGKLTGDAAARALPLLAQALASADGYSALSIANTMLNLGFEGKPMPENAQGSGLNERQRFVLTLIAQSDQAWICNGNMSDILRGYGVPDWREQLQAFLKDKAGSLKS